jgi:pimeloyl-ACP methyl ester carboxylesterase
LHGFPGNEKNLDLAQAMRRAGWNVLYFDYRGSWGSPGDFSFTHCLEDTQAAVAWLRNPANAARVRSDPKKIVLAGHSMGGFMALEIGAHDPEISGVIAISAADFGITQLAATPVDHRGSFAAESAQHLAAEGMAPLAGTSPETLAREIIAHATPWDFSTLASGLSRHPLLVITSDDGLRGPAEALAAATQKAGAEYVSTAHFPTDHSYSDHRIALEEAVLAGLTKMQ